MTLHKVSVISELGYGDEHWDNKFDAILLLVTLK